MQADLYLRADVTGWLTLYHDQGVYGAFESVALARAGPVTFTAGRFVAPYGWKLANHTAWTRERLGFGATEREVGLGVGLETALVSVQAAVFNGAGDDLLDDNLAKGVSARAEVRLGQGAVRARAGGSVYWNVAGEDEDGVDERIEDLRAGGFYAVFAGRLGLLGQVDYRRLDDRAADGIRGHLIGYHELSFLAWQGVDLRVTWEHLDDLDVEDDLLQRLGVGVELYPAHGMEVQLLARYVLADARLPESALLDLMAMLHLYF